MRKTRKRRSTLWKKGLRSNQVSPAKKRSPGVDVGAVGVDVGAAETRRKGKGKSLDPLHLREPREKGRLRRHPALDRRATPNPIHVIGAAAAGDVADSAMRRSLAVRNPLARSVRSVRRSLCPCRLKRRIFTRNSLRLAPAFPIRTPTSPIGTSPTGRI
jgi:hypothetical protein